MAEAFNGWILDSRQLTIVSILEEIRLKVMRRIASKRQFVDTWISNLSPTAFKKLEKTSKILVTSLWSGMENLAMKSAMFSIRMTNILLI